MEVDHIFIFSNAPDPAANELIHLGLTEGSSRVHKGQGTANRKFYFENFFLEVLWVSNEEELKRRLTVEIGLNHRANFVINGSSRYGLCLINTEATDLLFDGSQTYQPEYFPHNMAIDVLPNQSNTSLPWTFRLPYRGEQKPTSEPTNHNARIERLTKVEFGIKPRDFDSNFTRHFGSERHITFVESSEPNLILEFDDHRQHRVYIHKGLNLVLKY